MKHWVYNLPPGGQGSLPYQYLAKTGTCRQTDWGSRALNRAYNFNIFGALNRVSSSTWSIQYGANLGGTVRVYICGQWCVYKKKNSLNPNWRNNGELLKQSVTFGPQKKIFCLKHSSEMNGNRALLVRLIWLVWWNLCELQVHKSYDRVNLLYCNCQWMALKQDRFVLNRVIKFRVLS